VARDLLNRGRVLLLCWLAIQLPLGILVGKSLKSRVPPAF
jgi:hypothetical protein